MKKWYVVGLFNLFVLAILGLILRYKINFSLPFLNYTNVLHAHSHFAFNGWVTFVLQLLILSKFTNDYSTSKKFWNGFLAASTIINFATIVSFAAVGYAGSSIALSTVSLLLTYAFAYKIYKTPALKVPNIISVAFVQASLFFLILSSIGPYALAILMATNHNDYYLSQNALHFFLHFQYNGWFTFAVLSFLVRKLESSSFYNYKAASTFFRLSTLACIPSYLFNSIWNERPVAVNVVIIVTVLVQTLSLYYFFRLLRNNMSSMFSGLNSITKTLYYFAIVAFVLKVLFQFTSVYTPLASTLSSRPIVVGYLHLVFLCFVSMYIIALLTEEKVINVENTIGAAGLKIFTAGVIINEVLLAAQGAAGIFLLKQSDISMLLFANTVILVIGSCLLFISATTTYTNKIKNNNHLKLNYGNFRNTRYTTA